MNIEESIRDAYSLFESGQDDLAKQTCLNVLNCSLGSLDALFLLGKIAWKQRDLDTAEILLRLCTEINPSAIGSIRSLGVLLLAKHRIFDAVECFNRVLEIKEDALSLHNLAVCSLLLGLQEEAYFFERSAIEADPSNIVMHQQLMLICLYSPMLTPEQIYEEHLAWGRKYSKDIYRYTSWLCEKNSPRVKIGYLCHDTFKKSVSFFFGSTIKNHDRSKFDITVYAASPIEDDYTNDLKTYVDCWRNVSSLGEREIAEVVHQDKISILIDVTGHTAPGPYSKLLTFAYKPAPIQISWLAYAATTGLETIDYRITDEWADPAGMTEAYHTEKLIRLPQGFLCYQPDSDSPEVVDAPCKSNSYITFGSFSFPGKITYKVIEVWASILKKVKNSKLYLKYSHFAYPDVRSAFLERFLENGVDEDCVRFAGFESSYRDYLEHYKYIDIILDPFPYNGTTSTHEALWMGVPVITLAGNDHRSRVGVSILSRLGLPNLIAHSIEEYIQIAVSLAENKDQIQELRKTLRARMLNSPLTQTKQFTAQLEAEYIRLWEDFLSH